MTIAFLIIYYIYNFFQLLLKRKNKFFSKLKENGSAEQIPYLFKKNLHSTIP